MAFNISVLSLQEPRGPDGADSHSAPTPPRLLFDGAAAAALLCAFGLHTRNALTPDGVAYLENAELFATGGWAEALQGYWSPGYSLLLAPAAWLAGGDRGLLLLIAHIVQLFLGLAALWMAAAAVQRRAPPHAQRVVYWGCAWIILRWLTQEVLTPDLLLCTLVFWFVSLRPPTTARARAVHGGIIGAGFLVKSSIWPWLLVALALAVARSVRARNWLVFPATTVLVAVAISGAFVVTLSVRAGRPTLGSVGPLNARWYLGDRSRRTPDTDTGPHATKRLLEWRPGLVIAAHDLRPSTRTYAPWSDPERWVRGVPASSLPPLNFAEALTAWRQNAVELARWLLPLGVGLALLVAWTDDARDRGIRAWLRHRPLLTVGISAALSFAVVHAEHRLLAPAGLLLLLGAWRDADTATPRPRFELLAAVLVACVAVQLATYFPAAAVRASRTAQSEQSMHRFLAQAKARGGGRDVVVVGRFGVWMAILWRNQLRAAVQIDESSAAALASVPDAELGRSLRAAFGASLLGAAITDVQRQGRAEEFQMSFLRF
ncbi:MAG: hypothetical protein Q8K55_02995 [Gemmatimonadaceae bacterium]|nr:hypothetical protein [Gemmatimonadaceae bacterium]